MYFGPIRTKTIQDIEFRKGGMSIPKDKLFGGTEVAKVGYARGYKLFYKMLHSDMVSCQYVAYDLRTVRTDAKVQEANEYFGDMRDFYSGKKNLISLSISKIIAGYQPLKIKTGLALVIPSVAFMTGIFSYLENLTELGAKLLEGIGFGGAVESNPNLGALAWLLAGIAARVAMLRRYWVHRGKVFCTVHVMQDLENIGVDMKIPIGFVLFTRKPE